MPNTISDLNEISSCYNFFKCINGAIGGSSENLNTADRSEKL